MLVLDGNRYIPKKLIACEYKINIQKILKSCKQ